MCSSCCSSSACSDFFAYSEFLLSCQGPMMLSRGQTVPMQRYHALCIAPKALLLQASSSCFDHLLTECNGCACAQFPSRRGIQCVGTTSASSHLSCKQQAWNCQAHSCDSSPSSPSSLSKGRCSSYNCSAFRCCCSCACQRCKWGRARCSARACCQWQS